ncbi:MAG TPA: hypothetical protein VFP90_04490 [Gemmatimonadaceae bacterium]|nr:hypothetical protein [Gemmatimonadaceae bacterium]
MSPTVRVFVNGVGYDAPAGGTALDAVAIHRAADAAAVRAEALLVTDSRGLPIDALTPLFNGAVFRLVPKRSRDLADPAAPFDE